MVIYYFIVIIKLLSIIVIFHSWDDGDETEAATYTVRYCDLDSRTHDKRIREVFYFVLFSHKPFIKSREALQSLFFLCARWFYANIRFRDQFMCLRN